MTFSKEPASSFGMIAKYTNVWINRMSKAAQLLQLTDLSIRDIGKVVGYPNQLHFSRAFKNTYKISPSQWRKENKPKSANIFPTIDK